jgi:tagatose 6-phosphate kinase
VILCVTTTPVFQRSMTFERVRIDEVNRAVEVSEYASGKGVNVARVAHALGEEATVTGFVGGDSGKFIREQLNGWDISHDFITVGPRTRTCVTVIDRSSGAVTELVEEGRAVEPIAWESLRERVSDLLSSATMLTLSGSLPPGGPQDFYAYCVAQANQRGTLTIVDATGQPLLQALPHRPFIVKPNRSELAKAMDVPVDTDAALRDAIKRLIALGPKWAVITEGKAGAIVSNGEQFWRVRPPEVKAINPIGSGDSVAAGLAVAILRGQTLPDAARLAIACGAANAITPTAGLVRPDDVAALEPKVSIEAW